MAATFATSGASADATIEGRGKGTAGSWAGGEGGLSTGIGIGPLQSGPATPNQTATTVDALPVRIGGGVKSSAGSSNSDSNLGNIVNGATFVAGSGYTNGVYLIGTTGGGPVDGTGQLQVTVAGGAITAAEVTNPGSGFTGTPTLVLTALGGGTGGSVTLTTGRGGDLNALGAGYGTNKGTRYLIASGAVTINAAVSGGYLNRSGRAMVAGEGTWAVAP